MEAICSVSLSLRLSAGIHFNRCCRTLHQPFFLPGCLRWSFAARGLCMRMPLRLSAAAYQAREKWRHDQTSNLASAGVALPHGRVHLEPHRATPPSGGHRGRLHWPGVRPGLLPLRFPGHNHCPHEASLSACSGQITSSWVPRLMLAPVRGHSLTSLNPRRGAEHAFLHC